MLESQPPVEFNYDSNNKPFYTKLKFLLKKWSRGSGSSM